MNKEKEFGFDLYGLYFLFGASVIYLSSIEKSLILLVAGIGLKLYALFNLYCLNKKKK